MMKSPFFNKTEQKINKEGAKKSRILKKGDFIISNSMSFGRPYIPSTSSVMNCAMGLGEAPR
jgi:hypothetical protein